DISWMSTSLGVWAKSVIFFRSFFLDLLYPWFICRIHPRVGRRSRRFPGLRRCVLRSFSASFVTNGFLRSRSTHFCVVEVRIFAYSQTFFEFWIIKVISYYILSIFFSEPNPPFPVHTFFPCFSINDALVF